MSFQYVKQIILKYAPYTTVYCLGLYWLLYSLLPIHYSQVGIISNIIKYTVVTAMPFTLSIIFIFIQIVIGGLGCFCSTDAILENRDLNAMYTVLYVHMICGGFIIVVSILYMTQIVVAFYCFLNFSIWLQNSHTIRQIKHSNESINQPTVSTTGKYGAIATPTTKQADIEAGEIYLAQPCTKVYTASV